LLIKLLQKAARHYYEGSPIMSDEEFDTLAEQANWKEVGYQLDSSNGKVKHTHPLYSLQKHYEDQGQNPLSSYKGKIVASPKLDGASVALTYSNGYLVQVLTRGDGKYGIDVTDKFLAKNLVPKRISFSSQPIQITGEIVSPKSIPNSRNYAAGSLNLKSIDEFLSRDLSFIVHGCYPYVTTSFSEDMIFFVENGFSVSTADKYEEFPRDGIVFRIDNNQDYEKQGWTSHHPRGSFALKTRKEGKVTTLINVIWQTGKSGVVSPVGILEPIEIDGARITKATLHNIEYIRSLNLEIGCKVEVIRSGDIIPRITRRIEK
jgi:NAD-dependent DNA ligase